uniref:Uridine kinase n=1 Tax=Guillardia theta TaxID=55529 RepID=A0A7S4N6W7_GUITH|mmetsp:Transcript_17738/g.58359  ORF Transcript_17738/g.58359 Transcript_17738/m.58359 type:complete len:364 (+) Transcript_17738:156-1247(+)
MWKGAYIATVFAALMLEFSHAGVVENHQMPLTKKPSQERGDSICRHVQEASAEMQREEQQGTLRRSKSTFWIEGYKAGCMQFLQSYIPDHRDGKPLVVGIAGGSGSGKTTIMDVIVEHLGKENVAVLSHDNYYRHRPHLTVEERDNINFDHPDSLETELMVQHLQELINGTAVRAPVYDFATHLRKTNETLLIEPRPIILVEGILILYEQVLRNHMNLKVYVDVEADRRIIRRIDRDMVERGRCFHSIVHQYLDTVKPMHDAFVEPSKQFADVIIPFGGRNIAAIQVLLERLKAHMRNNFAYVQATNPDAQSVGGSDSPIRAMSPVLEGTPIYHSRRTPSTLRLPHEKSFHHEFPPEDVGYSL